MSKTLNLLKTYLEWVKAERIMRAEYERYCVASAAYQAAISRRAELRKRFSELGTELPAAEPAPDQIRRSTESIEAFLAMLADAPEHDGKVVFDGPELWRYTQGLLKVLAGETTEMPPLPTHSKDDSAFW